jgi:hypothetical protein
MGGEEFANMILGFGGLEDNFLLQVRSESGAHTLYCIITCPFIFSYYHKNLSDVYT